MPSAKRDLFIGVLGFLFIGTLLCAPNVLAQEFDIEPSVSANFERGITVTGHRGKVVSVQEVGRRPAQQRARANRSIRFPNLRAGRVHVVRVDGQHIARLVPVRRVRPITDLAFEPSARPDAVRVTWQHQRTKATGGTNIHYLLTAHSHTAPTISQPVHDSFGSEVTGLDAHARYTFELVAVNTIGVGPVASVTMQRSLFEMLSTDPVPEDTPPRPLVPPVPDQPISGEPLPSAPVPAPPSLTPSPPDTEPAAVLPEPSLPALICPDGFDDIGEVCARTSPYEYEYRDYTFTIQPLRIETYEDICSEAAINENGELIWIVEPYECTLTRVIFGPVQDPVPDGWQDTGTQWSRVAPPPEGWTDDGTSYIQTVEKIPEFS
jgi:hypothetical protein